MILVQIARTSRTSVFFIQYWLELVWEFILGWKLNQKRLNCIQLSFDWPEVLSIFRRTDGRNSKVIVWWALLTHTLVRLWQDNNQSYFLICKFGYVIKKVVSIIFTFIFHFAFLFFFILRQISYIGRNPKVPYINIRIANVYVVTYFFKFGINQLGSHPQIHQNKNEQDSTL